MPEVTGDNVRSGGQALCTGCVKVTRFLPPGHGPGDQASETKARNRVYRTRGSHL